MHPAPPLPQLIPVFEKFPEVQAFFSTRIGGVSQAPYQGLNLGWYSGDRLESVEDNWNQVLSQFAGTKERLRWLTQTHSALICQADSLDSNSHPEGDALITREKELILAVFSADCLPILIFDPATQTSAAVHAGWKGTQAGVLGKTLDRLMNQFQVRASTLQIAMGPCISSRVYEVGAEVARHFAPQEVQRVGQKLYLDLRKANLNQIKNRGIRNHQIQQVNFCTYSDKEYFFSYRREGAPTGRMAGLISLKPK